MNLEKELKIKNNICQGLIQKINRTILIHLSSMYPHLLQTEVDIEPRLEASWFTGGIDPPPFTKRYRKRIKSLRNSIDDPVDLPVQYLGQPAMHLRYKHPLREIIPLSECTDPALEVPTFKMCPLVLTYRLGRRHLTNIPGFWPGDENEFGFLSYHNCTSLQKRLKKYDDTFEALTVQAILASYSWLLSQACYQGIYMFNVMF